MPQASGSLCLVSERGLHRSFFGFYIWEPAFISYTPRFTRALLCVSLLGALITVIYVAVACYRGEEVKVWNTLLILGVFLLNAVMNWQALRHAPKENGKPLKHGNPGNEV